jgi:hypothetical protein
MRTPTLTSGSLPANGVAPASSWRRFRQLTIDVFLAALLRAPAASPVALSVLFFVTLRIRISLDTTFRLQ